MEETNNGLAAIESRIHELSLKAQAEPERAAAALARREALLKKLARLGIKAEMGPASAAGERETNLLYDELAEVDAEILVNGRRVRALEEMRVEAEGELARVRQREAALARARWEPALKARRSKLEQAVLDAATEYCAAVSLLDGIPPYMVEPQVLVRKLTSSAPGGFYALVHKRQREMEATP